MSRDSDGASGRQSRADQPQEQEAVRTTSVGGQTPRSGRQLGPIPCGVEVLVKKASVDPEFKEVLLAERAEAAERIGLTLDPAEALMLSTVPAEQLEAIIGRTDVPKEHRRVFLGTAAAAMLAAVGLASSGCRKPSGPVAGIIPDDPTVDENGRPIRNNMAGEGGAAPHEPPPREEASSEQPDPPEPGGEDSSGAPPESPDVRPTSRGIRPDIPARGGIRPDPKPQ